MDKIKFFAEVVELADAHGSGPCGLTPVRVQLPPSALNFSQPLVHNRRNRLLTYLWVFLK